MDILKIATDWAKDELVSTLFFILAGLLFTCISFGFWQFGKTELAKAYIIPMLVVGVLLMTIGFGLFFTNKARISQFETAYEKNKSEFVAAELERVDATLKEYKNIVFTVIPFIIMACGFGIFIMNSPGWRSSFISAIAMLSVILLIDGLAYARITEYKKALQEIKSDS